jgi:hypothetical protein
VDGLIDRQRDEEELIDGWTDEWIYKRMDSGRMERKCDRYARNNI